MRIVATMMSQESVNDNEITNLLVTNYLYLGKNQ